MSYQYFNIVNKKTLFLNGPKKWEAYKDQLRIVHTLHLVQDH